MKKMMKNQKNKHKKKDSMSIVENVINKCDDLLRKI